MIKKRAILTYTPDLIREPILHTLGQQFNVITNIHVADITKDKGWVKLELEGEPEDIEEGLAWIISRGMRVDIIDGDTVKNQS